MAAPPTLLERILARKRREIAERRARTPLAALAERAAAQDPCRGFAAALRERLAAPPAA